MPSTKAELAKECKRQSENCLYTSTGLYSWLRVLSFIRFWFVVLPIICGSLASWKLLTASDLEGVRILAAVAAFLAGVIPTIYTSLKLDQHLEQCRRLAGEYKSLQDRFRLAAVVTANGPLAELRAEVKPLLDRLDHAKTAGVTAPEWCFRRAQKKIKSGDYEFDVDAGDAATGDRRSLPSGGGTE